MEDQRTLKQNLLDRHLWTCFSAEFLGTCIFVFMVSGATCTWISYQGDVLRIALIVGLSAATLASSLGHITGGQVNPVVTLGFIVSKRVQVLNGLVFILAQFLGGMSVFFAILRLIII